MIALRVNCDAHEQPFFVCNTESKGGVWIEDCL